MAPAPTDPPTTTDGPVAGTDLNACELVTAADIAAALDLDAADVDDGEMSDGPTVLSPGRTVCRYQGDWGRPGGRPDP